MFLSLAVCTGNATEDHVVGFNVYNFRLQQIPEMCLSPIPPVVLENTMLCMSKFMHPSEAFEDVTSVVTHITLRPNVALAHHQVA